MTIYLYVKQCAHCGLKYFGKTVSKTPHTYLGSGKYWKNHIKAHGTENVDTLSIWSFDNKEECSNFALEFSLKNNITESDEWANLKPETGLDGGATMTGKSQSDFQKQRVSETMKGKSNFRGKKHSPETIAKIKAARALQKPFSEDTKLKMRASHLGKPLSEKHKASMRGKVPWNKKLSPHLKA